MHRRAFLRAGSRLALGSALGGSLLAACASPSPPSQPAATPTQPGATAVAAGATQAPPGPASASKPPPPTAAAAATAAPASTPGSNLARVTFGTIHGLGDAPVFVGMDQGFFAEQGIAMELVDFATAVDMIPPLGTGQLNAGSGISSAGLWNAAGRGVGLKVVAGTGANDPSPPPASVNTVLVRKELSDSGRVKTPADMRGLTLQTPPPGNAIEVIWANLLKSAGLTRDDFTGVQLAVTEILPAMTNGKVDVAATVEPTTTILLSQGLASVLVRDYEIYPNFQFGLLYFSPDFARSELAPRFMEVFLRGARLYNDAFVNKLPEARTKVVQALIAHTALKDPSLYDRINVSRISPDGAMNVNSLEDEQNYFLEVGEQQQRVNLETVIDLSLAQAAAAKLGPYR